MISPSTAMFAVSLAKGAIKLGHRLDVLLTEKEAVDGALVLTMPSISQAPSASRQANDLRHYLDATNESRRGDPIASEREELKRELAKPAPNPEFIGECYARVFPERLLAPVITPDADYLRELRTVLPTLDLSDPDTVAAAFHVAAGRDIRGINYATRVGLLVADIALEFGAENSARFVRDPAIRGVVESVLERFAEPELETFTEWSPLLRHALGATLDGLLGARAEVIRDRPWLAALLDVIIEARAGGKLGPDFLTGLFRGRAYPLLLREGLAVAAELLVDDDSDAFKRVAASVLETAAPLAAQSRSFHEFFVGHWNDLMRAGILALAQQSRGAPDAASALLPDVMAAIIRELGQLPQAHRLDGDALAKVLQAGIVTIAAKPELLGEKIAGKPWLQVLLASFVGAVAREGVQHAFTSDELKGMIMRAADVFARHPELIIAQPGLPRDLLAPLLRSVGGTPGLDARSLALVAVQAALGAIDENPALVNERFTRLLADCTALLAAMQASRRLQARDASALLKAVVATFLLNPGLFGRPGENLPRALLEGVLGAIESDPRNLLTGAALVETTAAVFAAFARHGDRPNFIPIPPDFALRVHEIVSDALAQAAGELGRRIDARGVPSLVAGLVALWIRGEIARIDPQSTVFHAHVSRLVAAA